MLTSRSWPRHSEVLRDLTSPQVRAHRGLGERSSFALFDPTMRSTLRKSIKYERAATFQLCGRQHIEFEIVGKAEDGKGRLLPPRRKTSFKREWRLARRPV